MDPAKRLCLKNLPENCTKREMAELVRSRTGAQPHSIDLGVDVTTGRPRRYGHVSCEGARAVLEKLSGDGGGDAGVLLRDARVRVYAARPHYTHRLAAARRAREADEAAHAAARYAAWQSLQARWQRRCEARGIALGELSPVSVRTPASFYATRRRFALVASEVAQHARAVHAARRTARRAHAATRVDDTAGADAACASLAVAATRSCPVAASDTAVTTAATTTTTTTTTTSSAVPVPVAATTTTASHTSRVGARARGARKEATQTRAKPSRTATRSNKSNTTVATRTAPPPPPPQQRPPQPAVLPPAQPVVRKEERKLAGLQAKLAALKAKLSSS